MKTAILLTLLMAGCATQPKVPINIYPVHTTMTMDVIVETYLAAQKEFERNTGCNAPKIGTVIVSDGSLMDLNKGHDVFPRGGGVSIAIGSYRDGVIYVAERHPDKPRLLFHEFLHFMFDESVECSALAGPENGEKQHFIIRFLTENYLHHTNREQIGNEWLKAALNELGINVTLKQLGFKED